MNLAGIIVASCVFIFSIVVNAICKSHDNKEIKNLEELNKKLEKLCVSLKEENEENKKVIH